MELYSVELTGDDNRVGGFRFHNTYKVVSDNIPSAIEKAINKMKTINKLDNVSILKVELIESGIIV